jgi:hypothetical protein
MSNDKRCHLEQGLLDLSMSHGIKFVRIIQVSEESYILEVTFRKLQAPYYLATARDPYNPREFLQIHTVVNKARELFALREVTIVFQ